MTRTEISIERDGQSLYLTIEGESDAFYTDDQDSLAIADVVCEGVSWDGELCATERAKAMFALYQARREARENA